jgi:hypothetical protein
MMSMIAWEKSHDLLVRFQKEPGVELVLAPEGFEKHGKASHMNVPVVKSPDVILSGMRFN